MYIAILIFAALVVVWLMAREAEPEKPKFDWTRRRRWWRPSRWFSNGR